MRKAFFVFLSLCSFGASALDVVTDPMLTLQNYEQMLAQYESALEQLNTLKNQYEQLQRLERQTTGSAGLGNLFIGALLLDDLPNDWGGVNGYVKHTALYYSNRAKYPKSSNAALNAYYDQRAISATMMQLLYSRAQQRVERVEKLRNAINLQTDPSRKAEMANRLSAETAAIQSDNRQMAMAEKNLAADDAAASHAAMKNHVCNEFSPTPDKDCK
jgi:hypothetical protein